MKIDDAELKSTLIAELDGIDKTFIELTGMRNTIVKVLQILNKLETKAGEEGEKDQGRCVERDKSEVVGDTGKTG